MSGHNTYRSQHRYRGLKAAPLSGQCLDTVLNTVPTPHTRISATALFFIGFGIDAGRCRGGVAEHVLHQGQVFGALQGTRGKDVPKVVRGHAHFRDAGALGQTPDGTRHVARGQRRRVARTIQRLAKRAGIVEVGVTPHYFRHVFATRALERTENLALVQDMLGHASPATTRVYAKTDEEQRREGYSRVWDGEG